MQLNHLFLNCQWDISNLSLDKGLTTKDEPDSIQRLFQPFFLASFIPQRTPQNSTNKELPQLRDLIKARENSHVLLWNNPPQPEELNVSTKEPSTLHFIHPIGGGFQKISLMVEVMGGLIFKWKAFNTEKSNILCLKDSLTLDFQRLTCATMATQIEMRLGKALKYQTKFMAFRIELIT